VTVLGEEVLMSVQQQLIKELEGVPPETQETILKLIRFFKNEILKPPRKKRGHENMHTLSDLDKLAIDTGIPDLADQHDHYLYGVPKK
jgi:hypothetical protein